MKKLLAIIVTLSFIAGPSFATLTRINSLGLGNDNLGNNASWMVQDDDTLLWMNPARTADNAKQLWVEAVDGNPAIAAAPNATAITNWGGITGKCPIVKGATVGLFVNRPYWGTIGNVGGNAVFFNNNPAVPQNQIGSLRELPGITGVVDPNLVPGYPFAPQYVTNAEMRVLTPATRFELLYVLPAMDKWTFGARLSSAGNTNNNDRETTASPLPLAGTDQKFVDNRSVQDTVLQIGAKTGDVGPFSVLDVILNVDMPSAENTFTMDAYQNAALGTLRLGDWKLKLDAPMNMSLTARGQLSLKGDPLLVYLNYANVDYSSKLTVKTDGNSNGLYTDAAITGDADYEQKRTVTQKTLTIGSSYNAQMSKKTLLIVGAALTNQTAVYDAETTPTVNNQAVLQEKTESTATNLQIGINMGLEHKVSGVVTGRLGLAQLVMQTNSWEMIQRTYAANAGGALTGFAEARKRDTTGLTENLGATAVTYGLGVNVFENFTIDALVRQDIQFTGGNILSGCVQKYVTQLTSTYKF